MRTLKGPLAATAVALVLVAAEPGDAAALEAGTTLDRSNWQQADGLLPPEILKHYADGEYENPIAVWPLEQYNWPPDFKAGSEANEGKFKVGPEGALVSTETGTLPPYVFGFPFPRIDATDPQAGFKAVWNYFYRMYYFGNQENESQFNWVGRTGLERRADVVSSFANFDGVPADERIPNPQNFLSQARVVVTSPADLNGTASLSWRYRDPGKRDSNWAYVPALRRVRAVSPANRSDGFLGSDYNQDDGPFFDGKPEDFDWTLKGEVDEYRIAESLNLQGVGSGHWDPVRGWNVAWADLPYVGYMDPAWKGVPWAPRGAAVLAKRRFWVVEGVPRDRYYLFGKVQLYLDRLTYQGAWNRKFDWKGELMNTMQVMGWSPLAVTRPDGKVDYLHGSNSAFQCAENIKLDRATVAGIKSSPNSGFYNHGTFPPDYFSTEALARAGK